jgi:hypothetical protein
VKKKLFTTPQIVATGISGPLPNNCGKAGCQGK